MSAAGLSEQRYTEITDDLTLAVARTLARVNLAMTFVCVSRDGSRRERLGRAMWARVKGRTENALLRLPFKVACMVRPGVIVPLHDIESRTAWYRWLYAAARPLLPVLRRLAPNAVTTTEQPGRAMIALAARGYRKRVLETADINAIR